MININNKTKLILTTVAFMLGGCSSNQEPLVDTQIGDIPQWVINPEVDDGIAATECVYYSGNFSIDKQQALTNARMNLAQQIQVKVSAMDKSYREKVQAGGKPIVGYTFTSVSKQLTKQNLVGITTKKLDLININDDTNLCMMVVVGEEGTKEIFNSLLNGTGISAKNKDILYQEFKAKKAHEELDNEMISF